MKVPKGKKVFFGAHRYKAGDELPAYLSEKLEKKPLDYKSSNRASVKPDAARDVIREEK